MSSGSNSSYFRKLETTEQSWLTVCSYGHEKRGKTFWALSAPGPIAVISSDAGTESAVRQWQRAGKEILLFQHTVPPVGLKIDAYEKAWDAVAGALYEAMTSKQFRSIVIDTATEFWELLRLARFGRLAKVMPHNYGPVNAEFRALLNKAAASGKNSIWIHKVKKVYKTNKDGVDSWTGEWERAGFADFGYIVDLVVKHITVKLEGGGVEFQTHVVDSRYRPTVLNGSVFSGIMALFPAIAMEALPETDAENWDDGVTAPEV